MAHIPDGVLAAPILIAGATVSAGLLALALRRLDYAQLPQAAVLSSVFFVAALINFPLGVSNVHLLLNGLMGLLLGWSALPALFVALLLQAVFFGFGGLLVLGVNSMNMLLPALLCVLLLRPLMRHIYPKPVYWLGAIAGFVGVMATAALVALSLTLSGEQFQLVAHILLLTYLPLAVLEALVTATILAFIQKVEPQLLFLDEKYHV